MKKMNEIELYNELYNKFLQNLKTIEKDFPNVRNMDKEKTFYSGWGCSLDIQTAREISELNILDSMEEGIMLEEKYPNIVSDNRKMKINSIQNKQSIMLCLLISIQN